MYRYLVLSALALPVGCAGGDGTNDGMPGDWEAADAPEDFSAEEEAQSIASTEELAQSELESGAAGVEELGSLEQALSSPSCVESRITSGGGVTVTNRCSSSQRVKVIWAFATDEPCIFYPPNTFLHYNKPTFGRFDGLDQC